jgi:hypothetical protein
VETRANPLPLNLYQHCYFASTESRQQADSNVRNALNLIDFSPELDALNTGSQMPDSHG